MKRGKRVSAAMGILVLFCAMLLGGFAGQRLWGSPGMLVGFMAGAFLGGAIGLYVAEYFQTGREKEHI